jgi:hypothetical protein
MPPWRPNERLKQAAPENHKGDRQPITRILLRLRVVWQSSPKTVCGKILRQCANVFSRRYATSPRGRPANRGLKPAATFMASLRDEER